MQPVDGSLVSLASKLSEHGTGTQIIESLSGYAEFWGHESRGSKVVNGFWSFLGAGTVGSKL